MAERKIKTAKQKLEELVSDKKAFFIRWYCADESEREPFETFSKKYLAGIQLDTAMNYLLEEDTQKAIKYWMNIIEQVNMIKLYKTMYKKAMEGSTDAANWIMKFRDSGYFADKESEISALLKGVDIGDDANGEE